MSEIVEIICLHCGERVVAYRGSFTFGGIFVTSHRLGIWAIHLAVADGIVAKVIQTTIPLKAFNLAIRASAGYIIRDDAIDMPTCPKCGKRIDLGI